MALPIRAGTVNTLNLGPALNIGTGVAMGSLNLAPSALFLSKNGGIFAAKADTNTAYADRSGWYKVPVSAADSDTGGRLIVQASPTSCLELWQEYEVMPAIYYDALYAGATSLNVLAVAASNPSLQTHVVATGNSVWQVATRALTDKANFTLTSAYDAAQNAASQASVNQAANSIWNNPTREVVATASSVPGFTFQAMANSVWAHILTGTLQAQQIQRGLIAVMAGKSSGGNTDTIRFRNLGDTTDVVVATMNTATGDRTTIVTTLT